MIQVIYTICLNTACAVVFTVGNVGLPVVLERHEKSATFWRVSYFMSCCAIFVIGMLGIQNQVLEPA